MKEDKRHEREGEARPLTAEAVYQGCLQQSHRYDDFSVRKENITVSEGFYRVKKSQGIFYRVKNRGYCNETFTYSKVIVTMTLLSAPSVNCLSCKRSGFTLSLMSLVFLHPSLSQPPFYVDSGVTPADPSVSAILLYHRHNLLILSPSCCCIPTLPSFLIFLQS